MSVAIDLARNIQGGTNFGYSPSFRDKFLVDEFRKRKYKFATKATLVKNKRTWVTNLVLEMLCGLG
jgi:hypothetical protein